MLFEDNLIDKKTTNLYFITQKFEYPLQLYNIILKKKTRKKKPGYKVKTLPFFS